MGVPLPHVVWVGACALGPRDVLTPPNPVMVWGGGPGALRLLALQTEAGPFLTFGRETRRHCQCTALGRRKFLAGLVQVESGIELSMADQFPVYQSGADHARPILSNESGGSDFRSGFENIILLYFLDPRADPWNPREPLC